MRKNDPILKLAVGACLLATPLSAQLMTKEQVAQKAAKERSMADAKKHNIADIYESIVRIEVSTQVSNYSTPWATGRFAGGTGTGFLIGKNRFMTNAHVVSNQQRILITKHGSPQKHEAKVLHIAHDCDLAILELKDFTPFENLSPLKFTNVPKLESEVRAIGYPVGGDRISVTRGVVSRIDYNAYSHSFIDSHLVVQIDAAINPGNSGGPVMQDGGVVGVAFQGLRSADNTGYMIPTPVVKRFLTDVEDGQYDHYVDLGVSEFPLFNPAMRTALGLKKGDPGVLVGEVTKGSSSDGVLEHGDILLSLDGNIIDSSGNVTLHGERVNMHEVVERKFQGDKLKVEYIRDGKKASGELTLSPFNPMRIYATIYGEKPRYTLRGGLVFQPLNRNTYSAQRLNNPRVRKIYSNYVNDGLFVDREDVVVLTRVLNDEVNSSIAGFSGNAVKKINGVDVKNLQHAHDLLHPEEDPEFFVIECDGVDRPLILPGGNIDAVDERIQTRYGVKHLSFLGK